MTSPAEIEQIAQAIVDNCPADRPPVLAVRANDLAFLGLLRGIVAAGSEPISVTYTWPGAKPWYSEKSCHFRNVFPIVNPLEDEDEAAARLVILGRALMEKFGKRSLVLPSSDSVQLLFFRHEKELSPYFDLMGDGNYASFRADITNKGSFFEQLSERHPQLCPVTFWCRNKGDLAQIADKAPFPVVVKPAIKDYQQSFYRLNDGSKAITVEDRETLVSTVDRLLDQGFELVVQERVIFDGVHDEIPFYTYIDRNSRVRLAASGIKEFIQPHPYGTATVLRLSSHPELIENAQKVADAIGWTGTLMIEFIRDKKDGHWKVIEVNTRPWLFHDFYRRFGMDFVPHAVLDHAGELPPATPEGAIKIPDQNRLTNVDPTHVELTTIATDICKQENSAQENTQALKEFVASYSSCHTLPQATAEDPEPARAMIEELACTYSLDKDDLAAFAIDRSGDDDDLTRMLVVGNSSV